MTHVKMTIHQALREVKMLNKKIASGIQELSGVLAVPAINSKIGSLTLAEWDEGEVSKYQSLMDLLVRREALKQKISEANATTKVMIDSLGQELTVAAMIDLQTAGLSYQKVLVDKLRTAYNIQSKELTRQNEKAMADAAAQARAIYSLKDGGNVASKLTDQIKQTEQNYYDAHKWELRDPIKILQKIQELENKIAEVSAEIDSKLSVANATTILDFSYKNYGES